jgi:hypothetical protein
VLKVVRGRRGRGRQLVEMIHVGICGGCSLKLMNIVRNSVNIQ